MQDPAAYSRTERLHSGRHVTIRSQRPSDRDELVAAVRRTSPRSLHRRFLGMRRELTAPEIAFFSEVDFVHQVALVATMEAAGRPVMVGGGRYIVIEPGRAEVAFMVLDPYQGQGVGGALLHHLAEIARDAGLEEFIAEVLPDNAPMMKVFERSGYELERKHGHHAIHVRLHLLPRRDGDP